MKRIFVILALTTVFGYLCWKFFYPPKAPEAPRGIILISLDTLRADHLGCYGYHRNTSPFIDTFAKKSFVFEHAVVQSEWTLPSHASIMTSLYPSSHGVTEMKHYLTDEHITLAELLKKGGYQTAAFTDGVYLSKKFGLGQGFDFYDGSKRIGIKRILPKVMNWLNEHKSDPFFLFIHCYDIHDPYNPPPPFDSIFHDFTYTGKLSPTAKTIFAANWEGLKVNDEDLRHFIALYDGGIRYTDENIGIFLSYLEDIGLADQTLIIITSDHGEEFKEHGRLGHGQIYYRPNLQVPLIINIPGYPQKEVRVSELVQSIDLLPTILELANLPAFPNAEGKSLLPLMKGYRNFFTRSLSDLLSLLNKDSQVSFSMEPRSALYSIITEGYQLIHNLNSNSVKLFNLESDPLAKNSIAERHDDVMKRLLSKLKDFNSATLNKEAPTIKLDEQTLKQLRALGYIDDQVITTDDDDDFDGIPDTIDNCLNCPNPNQKDRDGDSFGDLCDNCPDLPNPDQIDSNKDRIGDECEPTLENHWLEAEYADTIVRPLEVVDDEDEASGKYIYVPNGAGSQYKPGPIMATYKVNITQTGRYVLWGRVKASNTNDNSFFVQIDDGHNNLWEVETGNDWHWDLVNDRDNTDSVEFFLTNGKHTINVRQADDGTKLDKLLLTNKMDFIPSGKGTISKKPKLF